MAACGANLRAGVLTPSNEDSRSTGKNPLAPPKPDDGQTERLPHLLARGAASPSKVQMLEPKLVTLSVSLSLSLSLSFSLPPSLFLSLSLSLSLSLLSVALSFFQKGRKEGATPSARLRHPYCVSSLGEIYLYTRQTISLYLSPQGILSLSLALSSSVFLPCFLPSGIGPRKRARAQAPLSQFFGGIVWTGLRPLVGSAGRVCPSCIPQPLYTNAHPGLVSAPSEALSLDPRRTHPPQRTYRC